jgi:hypothetical protein
MRVSTRASRRTCSSLRARPTAARRRTSATALRLPGDDRLIAFYAAYRALVRAKVALLRAARHPASSSDHGRESAAARGLLGLAERFAWQARLPLVIVICGVPAAGKSHLAVGHRRDLSPSAPELGCHPQAACRHHAATTGYERGIHP